MSRKISCRPLTSLSRSTRGDLAALWIDTQTWTELPPAWNLAAWQSCWKRSPGSRRTLMWPSPGNSWKRDSSPQMTCDQAATIKFCQLRAQSRRSRRWLAGNGGFFRILRAWQPLAQVSCQLSYGQHALHANFTSLSEGTGTFKAVFTDLSDECAFLVGCSLSRGFCWLPWFQTSSESLPQEDQFHCIRFGWDNLIFQECIWHIKY